MSPKSERPSAARQRVVRAETGLNVGTVHYTDNESSAIPQRPRLRKTFSPRIHEERMLCANDLREIHAEFKADKLRQFSPTACARLCKVDESVYREWMSGEKSMPVAAEAWLPWPLVRRMRERADLRRTKRGDL